MSDIVGRDQLTFIRGDTVDRSISFKDQNQDPIDISGWVIYFTIKKNRKDSDDNAIYKQDITSHIDPTEGTTRLFIADSITEDWPIGSWYYDLQVKKSDDTIRTVLLNSCEIIEDITRRTS